MTYQRNIMGASSQDVLDEPVEDCVERAEVGRGDRDEEEGDRGCLDQRLAVRPLNALELGPTGDEEADDGAALALDLSLRCLAPALLEVLSPPLSVLLGLPSRPAADAIGGLRHANVGP